MKKYFKDESSKKISLFKYLLKSEKEYQEKGVELEKIIKDVHDTSWRKYELEREIRELYSFIKKIKHIYSCLGDVQIREDMIDVFTETFDSSKHRYGTTCYKKETIKAVYEISELFPELSKDALISIRKEYIKDLFDKYSLIDTLLIMIRKEGMKDSVFKAFMETVIELAKKEESTYRIVAETIRIFCGEYTYDFVRHFEKFIIEHHIDRKRFYECLPSPELILKDQSAIKEFSRTSKECCVGCDPITFQMLEDYLDGDIELSSFEEQPSYYVSTSGRRLLAPFTKTEFIKSITKEEQIKKLEK